jgi:hypothetical protein
MIDAAMIMASVVLANHMGLVEAAEKVTHYKFRILSCGKCATFWLSLLTMLVEGVPVVMSVAVAFVLAYAALWLELQLAILAKHYETSYDKISEAEADKDEAAD